MSNNAHYYHIWNPDNYLSAFVFIIFALGSTIFIFINDNLNSILSIIITILFFIELICSCYYFKKWKKEHESKKYTKHEKVGIIEFLIIFTLIILLIIGLKLSIEDYIDDYEDSVYYSSFTDRVSIEYYEELKQEIKNDKNDVIMSSFLLIEFVYLLFYYIIYVRFYNKYIQDLSIIERKEQKELEENYDNM